MSAETSTPLDKKVIREALAGYATAAEVIEQERIERLRRMTPRESWAIFTALIDTGQYFLGDPATLEVFEPSRIDNLLLVRDVLEKLARSQELL
ncbi:MAG: hypothetical protein K1X50_15105 [Candidatus Promineofilum sp.]|nr:hypothetical protein [Promineifilum sp.]MCW5863109.1 hypothetical protein [Anaerolineae bacterium]